MGLTYFSYVSTSLNYILVLDSPGDELSHPLGHNPLTPFKYGGLPFSPLTKNVKFIASAQ